jgi:hypothetical protein
MAIAVGDFVRYDLDALAALGLDPNREAEQELNANSAPHVVELVTDLDEELGQMVVLERELTRLGAYPERVLKVVPAPVETPPANLFPGVPDVEYPPE